MADDGKKGLDFKHPGGKEALLAGGIALALALVYFYIKKKNAANAATASQAANAANSPTALLLSWMHDHNSSSSSSATVTVPNVVGMTDTAGDAAITAVGLKVVDVNEKSGGSGGSSKITDQSPAAGTLVKPGSSVSVTLGPSTKKPVGKKSGDSGEG